MNKITSILLFVAVTFLIFHDQITLINSVDSSIYGSTNIAYKSSVTVDLHEQLHADTINFEKSKMTFADRPLMLIPPILSTQYNFITFNTPYRPPAV